MILDLGADTKQADWIKRLPGHKGEAELYDELLEDQGTKIGTFRSGNWGHTSHTRVGQVGGSDPGGGHRAIGAWSREDFTREGLRRRAYATRDRRLWDEYTEKDTISPAFRSEVWREEGMVRYAGPVKVAAFARDDCPPGVDLAEETLIAAETIMKEREILDDPRMAGFRKAVFRDEEEYGAHNIDREARIVLVVTTAAEPYGMGSAGPGGGKVFWYPYTYEGEKPEDLSDWNYKDIGLDSARVAAHEWQHTFGSHREFDSSSALAATCIHYERAAAGQPSKLISAHSFVEDAYIQAAYGKSAHRREGAYALRYLFEHYPDQTRESVALAMGGMRAGAEEYIDKLEAGVQNPGRRIKW